MIIKEPLLEKYHNQVAECLIENNISFEAEYDDQSDTKYNSVVHYALEFNGVPRAGFIGVNKGEFFGVVAKTENVIHLQKEGFEDDDIFNDEPIFASAPCVMAFVGALAMPVIKNLVFNDELRGDFDKAVKAKKKQKWKQIQK
jgi:hypothetical protein